MLDADDLADLLAVTQKLGQMRERETIKRVCKNSEK